MTRVQLSEAIVSSEGLAFPQHARNTNCISGERSRGNGGGTVRAATLGGVKAISTGALVSMLLKRKESSTPTVVPDNRHYNTKTASVMIT